MTEPTQPRSRPRAICLDLTAPHAALYPVPVNSGPIIGSQLPETFEAALIRLALETGLPVIALSKGPLHLPEVAEDAQEPHLAIVREDQLTVTIGEPLSRLERRLHKYGIPTCDTVFVSDQDLRSLSVAYQHVPFRKAIPTLNDLSHANRSAALKGSREITAQMAHTVLIPLDLELGNTPDADLLAIGGRLLFDIVLLLEEAVPVAGFGVKSLEKLAAGYAPILYGLEGETDPEDPFDDAMRRLRRAGAKRMIFVGKDDIPDAPLTRYADQARSVGFTCSRQTWGSLIAECHVRM
ncbi:hypothetical protein [Gymnodinialimonas ulvae]|uniref:hypothetical protein n=1 Tax=Gymnodinialimonas ulvae TaxID=3126504 RepID=UPI0030A37C16